MGGQRMTWGVNKDGAACFTGLRTVLGAPGPVSRRYHAEPESNDVARRGRCLSSAILACANALR